MSSLLSSEELLGVHEAVQIYSRSKLVIPLRLLHVNNLKYQLPRDVSVYGLTLHSQTLYR